MQPAVFYQPVRFIPLNLCRNTYQGSRSAFFLLTGKIRTLFAAHYLFWDFAMRVFVIGFHPLSKLPIFRFPPQDQPMLEILRQTSERKPLPHSFTFWITTEDLLKKLKLKAHKVRASSRGFLSQWKFLFWVPSA